MQYNVCLWFHFSMLRELLGKITHSQVFRLVQSKSKNNTAVFIRNNIIFVYSVHLYCNCWLSSSRCLHENFIAPFINLIFIAAIQQSGQRGSLRRSLLMNIMHQYARALPLATFPPGQSYVMSLNILILNYNNIEFKISVRTVYVVRCLPSGTISALLEVGWPLLSLSRVILALAIRSSTRQLVTTRADTSCLNETVSRPRSRPSRSAALPSPCLGARRNAPDRRAPRNQSACARRTHWRRATICARRRTWTPHGALSLHSTRPPLRSASVCVASRRRRHRRLRAHAPSGRYSTVRTWVSTDSRSPRRPNARLPRSAPASSSSRSSTSRRWRWARSGVRNARGPRRKLCQTGLQRLLRSTAAGALGANLWAPRVLLRLLCRAPLRVRTRSTTRTGFSLKWCPTSYSKGGSFIPSLTLTRKTQTGIFHLIIILMHLFLSQYYTAYDRTAKHLFHCWANLLVDFTLYPTKTLFLSLSGRPILLQIRKLCSIKETYD